MREEGTVVVHGFADIFYLARVTAVVVYFEIGANLVNALLGQLIHLSSLHLQDCSLLLCCQYFGVLGVDVDCFEEVLQLLFWKFQKFKELEYAEVFVFVG